MIQRPSDDFGGLCFLQTSHHCLCRVIVVGANGAGKTTFANRFADLIAAQVIHKDTLVLTTGWKRRSEERVQEALLLHLADQRWVLEGGPSILSLTVLQRADLVIWLDTPTPLRVWRIIVRNLRYFGRTRPEHPPGNPDWPGRRQWRFLVRAGMSGPQFAHAIETALENWKGPVIRLRTRLAVNQFLLCVEKSV